MKIAVDAMGGDFAPRNVIGGVILALRDYSQIRQLVLVGDESRLKQELEKSHVDYNRIEIVHAEEVVEMTDKSISAVRGKKNSSITKAVDLMKKGDVEAVISAGHTGASVAACSVKMRLIPGVIKPGIASPLPNEHGVCNILDAGANVEAKAEHLLQYGIMGSVYSKHVLKQENPRIGLMSVGSEDEKGSELTREVFAMLKEANVNFIGNVEGHDLFETHVDVVVCDGFTGNVILKSCEATAKIMFKWLKQEIKSSPLRMMGALLAKGAFKRAKERGSYETYGGSPLLGTNGICIIGHGSSSALAIKNAIRVAAESVEHRVNPAIEEEIANHKF